VSADALFSAANLTAVAGWLLLIVAPRRRWATLTAGTVIPLALAALYLVLLAAHWGETRGGFSSLPAVAELFSNHWLLLAGWIHYLAFDLFTGTWEVRDAIARGVPHWLVVPCLLLTFLFGPIGFMAYHAARRLTAGFRPSSPSTARAAHPSDLR
jgi:hypothetical protein